MINKNLRVARFGVVIIETEQDSGLWLRKGRAGPPVENKTKTLLPSQFAIYDLASLKL